MAPVEVREGELLVRLLDGVAVAHEDRPSADPVRRVVREAGDAELHGDLRSDRRLGQQPAPPEAARLDDGASGRDERAAVAAHGRDPSGQGAVDERRREPAEHDLDRAPGTLGVLPPSVRV